MHSYQKRSPAEPLALGTGDFEAVSYQAIPPAPRAPLFHHAMAPQPYGYPYPEPAPYGHVPAAAHSLSPMAMGSSRNANATGSQRIQPTVLIRSRPNAMTGASILIAGAILGGLIGLGVRARNNASDAAFAARVNEMSTSTTTATAGVAPVATAPASPVVAPQVAYTNVPFGSLIPAQPQQQPIVVGASSPAAAPVAVAPVAVVAVKKAPSFGGWRGVSAHAPATGGHPTVAAKVSSPKVEKDDGYKVASAGSEPKEASEPKVTAKAPKASEPKEAKASEPKEAKKAPTPKSGKSDDAASVLKAAMGATENTL